MIKIITLVLLLALAVQELNALPEEIIKIMNECKALERVTDADVSKLQNKVKPVTKEMKCYLACVAEKMGMISNNDINKEGCMKLVKSTPNYTEQMMQNMSEVIDECSNIKDADRCEYGTKLLECMTAAGAKRSMNNAFYSM